MIVDEPPAMAPRSEQARPRHAGVAERSGDERRAIDAVTHERYRADIDGLRALAVLPVVFYHAGVRGFSGGFVGVDIFFVISGYLITGILVRDIAVGRHSIAEFYRRRILRIFPALAAMLLATTIVAWFALLPPEMAGYAKSLGATALFASNFHFYWNTDYFNLGATSQPLLHTWSLAVEEQFYIVWPLILAAIGARRAGIARGMAVAVTIASLALSLWWINVDSAATFYLLPTRAWELGMGAVLAMVATRAAPRAIDELLGLAGLVLIAFAVKFYTHETLFPGLAAVPPCLGAALIIFSGRVETRTARLLSWAPLRFFGRISYSLYLWHWPVIVYADTALFLPHTMWTAAGVILVSIALAWASYRFVEQPFRHGVSGWRTSRVLAGGVAVIAATLALAVATPPLSGLLNRFTPAQAATAAYLAFDGDGAYRRNVCFQVGPRGAYDAARCLATRGDRPAILFAGDSHAAHLWPGLSHYRDRIDVLQATATGCVTGLYPRPRDYCQRLEQATLGSWLPDHRVDALILTSRWHRGDLPALAATLADLAIRAAHPILIGPMPEYATGLPRLMVWADRRHDAALPTRALDTDMLALDGEMRALAAKQGVPYISLVDLLCRNGTCRTAVGNDVPLLFDGGHLTGEGSAFVVDAIMPRIMAVVDASRGDTAKSGAGA